MGLIGLILASIVNIFLASSALQFAISVIGVLIFAASPPTTRRSSRRCTSTATMTARAAAKVSIFGALTLYLDFINMFQFLLALVGNRNE